MAEGGGRGSSHSSSFKWSNGREPHKGHAELRSIVCYADVGRHSKRQPRTYRWAVDAADDRHGQCADGEETGVEAPHDLRVCTRGGHAPFFEEFQVATSGESPPSACDKHAAQFGGVQGAHGAHGLLDGVTHCRCHGIQIIWRVESEGMDCRCFGIGTKRDCRAERALLPSAGRGAQSCNRGVSSHQCVHSHQPTTLHRARVENAECDTISRTRGPPLSRAPHVCQ